MMLLALDILIPTPLSLPLLPTPIIETSSILSMSIRFDLPVLSAVSEPLIRIVSGVPGFFSSNASCSSLPVSTTTVSPLAPPGVPPFIAAKPTSEKSGLPGTPDPPPIAPGGVQEKRVAPELLLLDDELELPDIPPDDELELPDELLEEDALLLELELVLEEEILPPAEELLDELLDDEVDELLEESLPWSSVSGSLVSLLHPTNTLRKTAITTSLKFSMIPPSTSLRRIKQIAYLFP